MGQGLRSWVSHDPRPIFFFFYLLVTVSNDFHCIPNYLCCCLRLKISTNAIFLHTSAILKLTAPIRADLISALANPVSMAMGKLAKVSRTILLYAKEVLELLGYIFKCNRTMDISKTRSQLYKDTISVMSQIVFQSPIRELNQRRFWATHVNRK